MKKTHWLVSLLLVLLLAFTGCTNPTTLATEAGKQPMSVEETLTCAMSALTKADNEEAVFLGADGTPVAFAKPDGFAAIAGSKITYTMTALEKGEQTARATLEITSPDMVSIAFQVLDSMGTYDETIFLQKVEEALQISTATKIFTVQVDLVFVNGQWCIVNNRQLSNAITGGLIDKYNELSESIMQSLGKGGEIS